MTTSIRSLSIIAIFVAAAIVPVASAGASVKEPVLAGYYSAAPVDTSSGSTSLTAISHDSSPTVAPSGTSLTALSHDSGPPAALHRDSSQAEPFVANLGPEPTTASGDGFDWGDAAIGAGGVVLAACLAMFAAAGISGRRGRSSRPATAASQGA
jgi:hypothetical protein